MKKEKTALVLFSVLALMAFAPMVQEHLDFPKVRPLAGVTEPVKMPRLNLKNYANGHFQRGAEKYVKYDCTTNIFGIFIIRPTRPVRSVLERKGGYTSRGTWRITIMAAHTTSKRTR